MPRPSILFHPEASRDYEQAHRWYFSRSRSVAADFENEIARAVRLIGANPLRWPRFDAARRRLVVRKFPYSVIYELSDTRVTVLAIAHGRRRPFYWRRRTRRR